jgi:hypothetical protein
MGPRDTVSYLETIVHRIVDFALGIIVLLLAARMLLKFFGANSGASFVSWLYGVTGQLVAPFAGIFPDWTIAGRYVIDFSTLFAMVAYIILGWLLLMLISFVFSTVTARTMDRTY